MKNIYDAEFFARNGIAAENSSHNCVPIIMSLLSDIADIKSVIDFGCGTGDWLKAFYDFGVKDILGIDGSYIDVKSLKIDSSLFMTFNLEQPIDLGRKFSLAISLEVAEHLTSNSAQSFIDSICKHSDVVLFGAAIPYQGGTGHINEQFPSYWVELFKNNGYECFDIVRPIIWNNDKISPWRRQNQLIFVNYKSTIYEKFVEKFLPIMARMEAMIDIVHPTMYLLNLRQEPSVKQCLIIILKKIRKKIVGIYLKQQE